MFFKSSELYPKWVLDNYLVAAWFNCLVDRLLLNFFRQHQSCPVIWQRDFNLLNQFSLCNPVNGNTGTKKKCFDCLIKAWFVLFQWFYQELIKLLVLAVFYLKICFYHYINN